MGPVCSEDWLLSLSYEQWHWWMFTLTGVFSLLFRAKYMEYYESRDLKAFSAEPLLVYPTHYTGQPGYLSDTETSTIWDNETVSTDWDRTHSWKSRQQGKIHSDAQNKDALPSQSSLNAPSSRDELWLPASPGTLLTAEPASHFSFSPLKVVEQLFMWSPSHCFKW